MTDHDALLAAVIANKADDTPRLVMADWFEENGQEERAEFIRVQIELTKPIVLSAKAALELAQSGTMRDYLMHSPIAMRDLLVGGNSQWGLPATAFGKPLVVDPDAEFEPVWIRGMELVTHRRIELTDRQNTLLADFGGQCRRCDWHAPMQHLYVPLGSWKYSRGFLSEITTTWEDWLKHADEIRKTQPIEKVTSTSLCSAVFSLVDERTIEEPQNRMRIIRSQWMVSDAGFHSTASIQTAMSDRDIVFANSPGRMMMMYLDSHRRKVDDARTPQAYAEHRWPGIEFKFQQLRFEDIVSHERRYIYDGVNPGALLAQQIEQAIIAEIIRYYGQGPNLRRVEMALPSTRHLPPVVPCDCAYNGLRWDWLDGDPPRDFRLSAVQLDKRGAYHHRGPPWIVEIWNFAHGRCERCDRVFYTIQRAAGRVEEVYNPSAANQDAGRPLGARGDQHDEPRG